MSGHSAVVYDSSLYVFGGLSIDSSESKTGTEQTFLNDLWKAEFSDTNHCQWTKVSTTGISPPAVSGHSANIVGREMWICCGSTQSGPQNLTFVLNFDNFEWRQQNTSGAIPSGREMHATSVIDSDLFMFGGRTVNGFAGEVYQLDTRASRWSLRGDFPLTRCGHGMVVSDGWLTSFGGKHKASFLNCTVADVKISN